MLTPEQIEKVEGVFDFYTETHPDVRFPGDVEWFDAGLEGEARLRVRRTEINVVRGRCETSDPAVAYSLLVRGERFGLKPGEWYNRLVAKLEQPRKGKHGDVESV